MQRPVTSPLDPDLVRQVRELGRVTARLQRMVEERDKRSSEDSAAESAGKFRQILHALTREPVEDGVNHSIQPLLQAYLAENPRHLPWTEALGGVQPWPSLHADFLRVAGRVRADAGLRDRLLEEGLDSESVEVRDAATQAAALWGHASAAEILQRHHERVPWLAEYKERVISDIRHSEVDARS